MKTVGLFAPPNCTGNSGIVGDTILQTSLVRTLLDRSLFPNLKRVHWWGARSMIEKLFPYLKRHVKVVDWDGSERSLPPSRFLKGLELDVALLCMRREIVLQELGKRLSSAGIPSHAPAKPLQAQSAVHLCRQLHSTLLGLDVHVTDVPSPRILVDEAAFNSAKANTTQETLVKASSERTIGKQDYDPEVDQLFLLVPAVGAQDDARTWSRDTWTTLARTLSEVGVVVVHYNPDDPAQRQSASSMVAGPQSFKSRFAVGLSLRDLAAWACVSTVTIARDSGPMHVVAAAVGPYGRAHVIGLLSVMHPGTWKPLSDNLELLGQWPLPLERCVKPDDVATKAAAYQHPRVPSVWP